MGNKTSNHKVSRSIRTDSVASPISPVIVKRKTSSFSFKQPHLPLPEYSSIVHRRDGSPFRPIQEEDEGENKSGKRSATPKFDVSQNYQRRPSFVRIQSVDDQALLKPDHWLSVLSPLQPSDHHTDRVVAAAALASSPAFRAELKVAAEKRQLEDDSRNRSSSSPDVSTMQIQPKKAVRRLRVKGKDKKGPTSAARRRKRATQIKQRMKEQITSKPPHLDLQSIDDINPRRRKRFPDISDDESDSSNISTPRNRAKILAGESGTFCFQSMGEIKFDLNTSSNIQFQIDLMLQEDFEQDYESFLSRAIRFEEYLLALDKVTAKTPFPMLHPPPLVIRPFLSSTFRDFDAERTVMNKTTFPLVQTRCLERGVFFAPLDLRWGVTSDQSGSGQVLKICCEEIDLCRPYFLGFLGFRNGWSLPLSDDDEDDPLLTETLNIAQEQFPWIKEYRDRSITELEMLHGVLNDTSHCHRSFFYFRSHNYLFELDIDEYPKFIELGAAEKKVMDLKRRIIAAGFKVRFFSSPDELAMQLQNDLGRLVIHDYPKLKDLTPFDVELKSHETFADSRRRVYVGGDEYREAIHNFVFLDKGTKPLIITGEAGVGKSSAIANWVQSLIEEQAATTIQRAWRTFRIRMGCVMSSSLISISLDNAPSSTMSKGKRDAMRRRSLQPQHLQPTTTKQQQQQSSELKAPPHMIHGRRKSLDRISSQLVRKIDWNAAFVFVRYLGATPNSTAILTVVYWLLEEIQRKCKLNVEIPKDLRKLVSCFPAFLEQACTTRPVLIVLDGLEALDEGEEQQGVASMLAWLPSTLPRRCKIVVSAPQESQVYQLLKKQNCPTLLIKPFDDIEVLTLSRNYLSRFGKSVDEEQQKKILDCPCTRHPLYMRTVLEEIRTFGSYETLNEKLSYYLKSSDVPSLFHCVLDRLEADLSSSEAPELVSITLSMIALSRRGLHESELRDIIRIYIEDQEGGGSFPVILFAALMLQLRETLLSGSGTIDFSHRVLQEVAEQRYLNSIEIQIQYHRLLTDYFIDTPRRNTEYPYHLSSLLKHALSPTFSSCTISSDSSSHPPSETDSVVIDDSNHHDDEQQQSQQSLDDISKCALALEKVLCDWEVFSNLCQGSYLVDLHKYWQLLEEVVNTYPQLLNTISPTPGQAYKKSLIEQSKSISRIAYAERCDGIATFLSETSRVDCVIDLYQEAYKVRQTIPQNESQATTQYPSGRKASFANLTLTIPLDNATATAEGLLRMGDFYERRAEYSNALKVFNLALEASIPLVTASALEDDLNDLDITPRDDVCDSKRCAIDRIRCANIRASIAAIYESLNKPAEALEWYIQSLHDKIVVLGEVHRNVAISKNIIASLHVKLDHFSEALVLYHSALTVFERVLGSYHPQVAAVLISMASCYTSLQQYSQAIVYYTKAKAIKEEALGANHISMSGLLNNLAAAYHCNNNFNRAFEFYEASLKIGQIGNQPELSLVPMLTNIGQLLVETRKPIKAIPYLQRAYDILSTPSSLLQLEPCCSDGMNDSTLSTTTNDNQITEDDITLPEIQMPTQDQLFIVISNLAAAFLRTNQLNEASLLYEECKSILDSAIVDQGNRPLIRHILTALQKIAQEHSKKNEEIEYVEEEVKQAVGVLQFALEKQHGYERSAINSVFVSIGFSDAGSSNNTSEDDLFTIHEDGTPRRKDEETRSEAPLIRINSNPR